MTLPRITALFRVFAALAATLVASCGFLQSAPPASPLIGNWTTADRNKVTFQYDSVIVTPEKGPSTRMGPTDCNGRYQLQYGRMETAALERSFQSQADLQNKLKQYLTQPEYPVADVTCDQGGTTYLMLDQGRMLAVYRDAGVGGVESYSRL